jgi:RHS repeat-associated protein
VFTFDGANRLTQATLAGITTQYASNGDGVRVGKTTSGQPATTYVQDVGRALPVVLSDGQASYVYGLGLIARIATTGEVQYYHADGLGSVRAITNAAGQVMATYEYDAFGAIRSQTRSAPDAFRFTGEQQDAESGLLPRRARMHDPSVGRCVRLDPPPGVVQRLVLSNHFVCRHRCGASR